MAARKCKKISISLEKLTDERSKRVKANTQIFFTASMMTSKTARVRSSSLLRQSILDSVERNVGTNISIHQACREGIIDIVAKHLGNPNTAIDDLDSKGFAPLHYAARYKQTEIVSMLLNYGADVNIVSGFECRCMTPLHLAVRSNCFDVVCLLLEKGAELDKRSFFGQHALHYAARRSSIDVIKLLLDPKVSPKVTDNEGCTPLHVAAAFGRLDAVKLLLMYGADPCQMDCDQCTAIHCAAKEGRPEILRELLKTASMAEVSFFEVLNTDRRDTNSSLHLAVENGHVESAKVCIEYGADPSAVQDNLDTPLHVACNNGHDEMVALLLFHGAAIDAEDKDGMTPLLRASLAGKVGIIDILLNEGASVLPPPGSSLPAPLLCAVKRGHHEAVMYLLQRGSPIVLRDSQFRSCLHIAVYTAGIETVKVILKNGGCVLLDSRDKDDKIPMHYAAAKGDIEIIEELLQAGSRVDLRDEDEKLPLHYAAENGHLECVQVLIKKLPSSVDSIDSHLCTPLIYATIGGHSRVVRYLLNKGAETDNRDSDHMTPLIHAAKCGCCITTETLLDNGAKIDAVDKDNNTALVTAAVYGKSLVVTMLLDRGADVSIISLSDHNCLTAATAFGHRHVCMAIVNHSRWEEACQFENSDGHPPMKSLIEQFPDVAKVIMDKCIMKSHHQKNHEKFEVTYRFEYLDPDPHGQTFSREKKFFAPKYMLQGVHKDLLFHPLTLQLVRYKWKCFGLRFFYGAAILHVFFVLLLTLYIMCTNNMFIVDEMKKRNIPVSDDQEWGICTNDTIATWGLFILVISVFNLCIEGYQMYVERWGYIDTSNVVELSTFSCSLVAVIMRSLDYYNLHPELFWSFIVVAVLFTYLTMLIQLQSLFDSGIYVTMLFEVFKTMMKVVIFFVLVFFVYALVFHLLLATKRNRALLHLPYSNTSDAFGTLHQSLTKTLVMTIGEVEYTKFFVDQPLDNPNLAQAVFASFCLILPIVLMNLMIGLAVGDIDSIQKNAELKRLAVQVQSIYEFEEKLPSVLLRRFYQRSYVYKPNRKAESFWDRLRCRVNDQLFAMTDKHFEATSSLEDWARMTESLGIKMQKQEERVQVLMAEVKQQKDVLNKMLNRVATSNINT